MFLQRAMHDHCRVNRKLMGRQTQQGRDGVWIHPPREDAMAEAVMKEVETYIYCHQNTVEEFIDARPIMDLCMAAERIPGPQVSKRRWEQDGVDVEGNVFTACYA